MGGSEAHTHSYTRDTGSITPNSPCSRGIYLVGRTGLGARWALQLHVFPDYRPPHSTTSSHLDPPPSHTHHLTLPHSCRQSPSGNTLSQCPLPPPHLQAEPIGERTLTVPPRSPTPAGRAHWGTHSHIAPFLPHTCRQSPSGKRTLTVATLGWGPAATIPLRCDLRCVWGGGCTGGGAACRVKTLGWGPAGAVWPLH